MEKDNKLKRIEHKTMIDKIVKYAFLSICVFCSLCVVFIALFIFIKGITPFFKKYETSVGLKSVNFFKFIFGGTWFKSPNIYGAGYIVINTLIVVILSLLISVPLSVLTALFVVRIAPKKLSMILSIVIELLSGIPSIIYGLFGLGVLTKLVEGLGSIFGIQTAGGISLLATVLVLSIMILPTITTIAITSISSVNNSLILGSLALGASPTQTNFKVVLIGAKSGIFSGIILGIGRALGEATAITMVCGNSGSGISLNPFDITRTLTSTMLQGIHESSGMDYDIRFSIGLLLIVIIIVTNLSLNLIKNRIGNNDGNKKKNKRSAS